MKETETRNKNILCPQRNKTQRKRNATEQLTDNRKICILPLNDTEQKMKFSI